jgi:hypothetical protein
LTGWSRKGLNAKGWVTLEIWVLGFIRLAPNSSAFIKRRTVWQRSRPKSGPKLNALVGEPDQQRSKITLKTNRLQRVVSNFGSKFQIATGSCGAINPNP